MVNGEWSFRFLFTIQLQRGANNDGLRQCIQSAGGLEFERARSLELVPCGGSARASACADAAARASAFEVGLPRRKRKTLGGARYEGAHPHDHRTRGVAFDSSRIFDGQSTI